MFALTSSKHDLAASYSQICARLATLKAYLTVLPCCVFHNLASSNYLSVKLDTVVGKIFEIVYAIFIILVNRKK